MELVKAFPSSPFFNIRKWPGPGAILHLHEEAQNEGIYKIDLYPGCSSFNAPAPPQTSQFNSPAHLQRHRERERGGPNY
jgi:hypothetical protein